MKVYVLTSGDPVDELRGVCGCFTSHEAAVQSIRDRYPGEKIKVRNHPHKEFVTWIEVWLPNQREIEDYIVEEYTLEQ